MPSELFRCKIIRNARHIVDGFVDAGNDTDDYDEMINVSVW